ncbi:hypothetical protein [Streptomyces spiralis]|uniref:hypothetical protein n=1 Tax=Streptomyces spiralis TaxID=66376 RepID=UPI0033F9F626
MQWRDDSGGAYVEDPYGGAPVYAYGHEYAHGHTYGYDEPYVHDEAYGHGYGHGVGATTTDTATLYRPYPAQPQWTYPEDGTHSDVLSDVLTVAPQGFEPPGLADQVPDTPAGAAVRPVFVDSSGRRQRRVLRAARLLMIPAGGYVALLVSAVLGGPSITSPSVPQTDSAHRPTPQATAPDSAPPGTGHSTGRTSPDTARQSSRPTAQSTAGPTDGTAVAPTAPTATSGPTAAPTRTTSPASAPTAGSTPDPSAKGRAVGSTHRPVK